MIEGRYVFLSGGISIFWCSKKQNSISLLTTKAEYKVVILIAQEFFWLQSSTNNLYHPLTKPTTLCRDDQSAFKLTNNLVFYARTKHIKIKYHFIR